MDDRIEAIFAAENPWRDHLAALRRILKSTPLVEEYKWRAPCYTYRGVNIATVWGLKDAAVLSFFKGALLDDPAGILEPPGPNSRSARTARFTRLDQIDADILKAYVAEAIAKSAEKVDLSAPPLLPDEIAARMDPALRTAFDALTPGRQRGWIVHITGAKQPATRLARLEKAAPSILKGKGLHDR